MREDYSALSIFDFVHQKCCCTEWWVNYSIRIQTKKFRPGTLFYGKRGGF